MTYSVVGNILLPKDVSYDYASVNELVMQHSKKFPEEKTWGKEYSSGVQPFIWVLNNRESFRDTIDDLIVEVRSGSHVSTKDTAYALEIYIVSMNLYCGLHNEKAKIIFSEEEHLYTPQEFFHTIIKNVKT